MDGALWDFVVALDNVEKLNDTIFLNKNLDDIENKSASVCEFFRPCPLITLPEGIDRIRIGRVAVEMTESRLKEFLSFNNNFKFRIKNDWSLSINLSAGSSEVVAVLPPRVWSINLAAADPIREEEGLWLTDVSLSLMRMCVRWEDLGALAPVLGKIEPHPFSPHDLQDHSLPSSREVPH